jgi:hypothetical protein
MLGVGLAATDAIANRPSNMPAVPIFSLTILSPEGLSVQGEDINANHSQ